MNRENAEEGDEGRERRRIRGRREKEKGRFGIGGEVVRCWIEIFEWSGDSFWHLNCIFFGDWERKKLCFYLLRVGYILIIFYLVVLEIYIFEFLSLNHFFYNYEMEKRLRKKLEKNLFKFKVCDNWFEFSLFKWLKYCSITCVLCLAID